MKRILSGLALCLVAASGAQAQIAKGTNLLTGTVGYTSITSESGNFEFKTTRFEGNAGLGRFLADNLLLGLNMGYANSTDGVTLSNLTTPANPYVPYGSYNLDEFSLGPMLRYYLFVGGEQAAFFGQAGAGYRKAEQLVAQPAALTMLRRDVEGMYAQLTPGFVFFPTPKFGLELSLRGLAYERLTQEARTLVPETKSHELDFGFNLSDLRLGASFYLGRN